VAVDAAMCAEIEALAGGVGIFSSGALAQAMCGGWAGSGDAADAVCVCTHSAMSVRRDALGDGM
jgi:hypothetical protein